MHILFTLVGSFNSNMDSLSRFKDRFRSLRPDDGVDYIHGTQPNEISTSVDPSEVPEKPEYQLEVAGIAKLEAAQAVWGRTGRYFLYFG